MIDISSRPRLSPKTKLRLDRKTARHVLLLPEKGLVLNSTASAVALLCTGEHSVATIIERLCGKYADVGQDRIQQEVLSFLAELSDRGLLETVP